ncbi:MAG: biotin/lipoyl-containing protein [Parvularcula sp.]|jgi:2-oxoglutarate dehydrogenase E2 component (dihydrolipoamide succinyltransferase)|nr:biotin/lipoyl-containing protein [Parvularcula sp.]
MKVDIAVPEMGEGVTHATVGEWLKKKGDHVKKGEAILDIATDKVGVEVEAPASGVLCEQLFKTEDEVQIGAVVGRINTE